METTSEQSINNILINTIEEWFGMSPQNDEIQVAVIFGSLAKGLTKDWSDIDIAFSGVAPLKFERKVQLISGLTSTIHREFDLVDLWEAHSVLLGEIFSHGIIVKKKNPIILARILNRMWSHREDFEPIRNKILESRRKRVFGA